MFKNIIKYTLIFIITVFILFSALVLTSKIPKSAIIKNLEESAIYYKSKMGIQSKKSILGYELLHYYADSMLLNITNYIDEDNPIKSSMEAKYYKVFIIDTNIDFVNSITQKQEPNKQYIRYWHGSLAILRPLMTILNIEQVYNLNKLVFSVLFILLTVLLIKKYKVLALVFVLSSIMTTLFVTPYCIEYIWTVLIMLIVSIISIIIEKKGNNNLYVLYFITGIITCFLDFLSTETLTILVPIIFVTLIRYKENRLTNFKDGFKFIIISGMVWFISYALMWFAKWILASIILDMNAFDYVKEAAMFRIGWNIKDKPNLDIYLTALNNNIRKIYLFKNIPISVMILGIIALISTLKLVNRIIIKKKEKMKNDFCIKFLLLIVAIIPYIRFCVLANHSTNHSFFTYRAQLPSLIAIIFIVIYSLDKNIREKIKIKLPKRKNKNERKRINNINSSTK